MRAQISLYIIIGLIILIATGTTLYITSIKKPVNQLGTIQEQRDTRQTVEQLVTSCLKIIAEPLVTQISLNGGELNPSTELIKFQNKTYNFQCIDGLTGCANKLITRTNMEEQLNQRIKNELGNCLNFTVLEERNYEIKKSIPEIKTLIGTDDVIITLIMPIEATLGGVTTSFDTFTTTINYELGRLYDLATNIVLQESINNTFDETKFMNDHSVIIEKHKPYPNTIYSLQYYNKKTKITAEYNFAVGGTDTTATLIWPRDKTPMGYCSTKDKNCYANVGREKCTEEKGQWTAGIPAICTGSSIWEKTNKTKDCMDKKNKESWCLYDNVAGSGYDLVGTRQYQQTCIDGKIYTTECRDYRDEICVQTQDSPTTASCRDNRWEDCAKQENQETCEDKTKRDCQWVDDLVKAKPTSQYAYMCKQITPESANFTNKKCTPYVPPGFKHWEGQGYDACNMADEAFDCDWLSCPQIWTDSTEIYCFMQGDCGSYYNQIGYGTGYLSKKGYYNTETQSPRDYVYDIPRINPFLNLPLNITASYFDDTVFENYPAEQISKNYNLWQNKCSKPIVKKKIIYMNRLHVADCNVWQVKESDQCEKCTEDPRKICSEYMCKSIGKNCWYNKEEQTCITLVPDNVSAKVIESQIQEITPESLIVQNITSIDEKITTPINDFEITGEEIQPQLNPYAALKIKLTLDKDVKCKIAAYINTEYESLPQKPGPFSKTQEFTYLIPSQKMKNRLFKQETGLSSPILAVMFSTYEKEINDSKKAMQADLNDSQIEEIFGPITADMQEVMPQLIELEKTLKNEAINEMIGRQDVFFICQDQLGNENKYFVRINTKEDTQPPKILKITPTPGIRTKSPIVMELTTNEPAQCRWSNEDKTFEQMDHEIDCTTEMNTDTINTCIAQIEKSPLYLMCQDNPLIIEAYYLKVTRGNETVFIETTNDLIDFVNDTIIASDYMLNIPGNTIKTDKTQIDLKLETQKDCKWTLEEKPYDYIPEDQRMACQDNECKTTLSVPGEYLFVCQERAPLDLLRNKQPHSTKITYELT